MKKILKSLVLVCLGWALLWAAGISATLPDQFAQKAREMEQKAYYTQAIKDFQQASNLYLQQGAPKAAEACRIKARLLGNILQEYDYDKSQALKVLQETFPGMSEAEREKLLEKADYLTIDGKPRYFDGFAANLMSRNPELMKLSPHKIEGLRTFYRKFLDLMASVKGAYPEEKSRAYVSPITYQWTTKVEIPRKELPVKGLFRLWVPVPVETAAQRNIKVYEANPGEFAPFPPQIAREIGLAYFEVPLEKLKENLNISVKFLFTHYAQLFQIDPERVGSYNPNKTMYLLYTACEGNASYTPEMQAKALEVVGSEKNPYLRAKALYYYIVKNISYSLMPHCTLSALNKPESIFVFEKGYGDCGAQSTYFVALCRSLGIPARITGGFQLWPGYEGPHFWAEFYLPNYGWIPVDTSAAQLATNLPELSEKEVAQYVDYFFGSQDPCRFIIQTQGDATPLPLNAEPLDLRMAIQFPTAECSTMEQNPNILVQKYLKTEFSPVDRN